MTKEQRPRKLSTFWIGPLVAGSFLAAGYEVTQRFMILRGNQQGQHLRELFADQRPFPGKSLEAFRQGQSTNSSKFQLNANTKLTKEKQSNILISNFAKFQEKEMQTMLKALETKSNEPEISNRDKIKTAINSFTHKQLPHSRPQPSNQKNNFDELFKTLPTP